MIYTEDTWVAAAKLADGEQPTSNSLRVIMASIIKPTAIGLRKLRDLGIIQSVYIDSAEEGEGEPNGATDTRSN